MNFPQYRLARDIERLWLKLQTRYDLEVEKDRLAQRPAQEVTVRAV